VSGNYVGVDITGTAQLPNSLSGISIVSTIGNVIGGSTLGSGNLISGNGFSGILVTFFTGTRIQGNLIRSGKSGLLAISNQVAGVGLQQNTTHTLVGGVTSTERNLISGNASQGLVVITGGSTDNTVTGNFIGTDLTGLAPLANSTSGVVLDAPGNTIGGT